MKKPRKIRPFNYKYGNEERDLESPFSFQLKTWFGENNHEYHSITLKGFGSTHMHRSEVLRLKKWLDRAYQTINFKCRKKKTNSYMKHTDASRIQKVRPAL